MGLLSDYRKKRQERRRKREEAQAEARRELHDAPPVTRQKKPGYPLLAGVRARPDRPARPDARLAGLPQVVRLR